jgi:hypothetical protein
MLQWQLKNIAYINVALTIPTALTSPLLNLLSCNELVGVFGAVISSSPSPSSHIFAVIYTLVWVHLHGSEPQETGDDVTLHTGGILSIFCKKSIFVNLMIYQNTKVEET